MTEKEFSLRLAQLRSEKGVSARDMSLSIGQNASYINNIENGKALPSMTGFFYICEYLNITPGEFFDAENKNPEKFRKWSRTSKSWTANSSTTSRQLYGTLQNSDRRGFTQLRLLVFT